MDVILYPCRDGDTFYNLKEIPLAHFYWDILPLLGFNYEDFFDETFTVVKKTLVFISCLVDVFEHDKKLAQTN